MPAKFKTGDRVRFKKPVLSYDHGTFVIRRVADTTMGYPCFLEGYQGYPGVPEDNLELVTPSREDPRDRRIRELEDRVTTLEVHLKLRLP